MVMRVSFCYKTGITTSKHEIRLSLDEIEVRSCIHRLKMLDGRIVICKTKFDTIPASLTQKIKESWLSKLVGHIGLLSTLVHITCVYVMSCQLGKKGHGFWWKLYVAYLRKKHTRDKYFLQTYVIKRLCAQDRYQNMLRWSKAVYKIEMNHPTARGRLKVQLPTSCTRVILKVFLPVYPMSATTNTSQRPFRTVIYRRDIVPRSDAAASCHTRPRWDGHILLICFHLR